MSVKVHAPEFWVPKALGLTQKRQAILRENFGVDPAILAIELGVKESTVRKWQRRLGLRRCANPRDHGVEACA